jgi:NADH:ubiquinone oxidoreductase subunit C
MAGDDIGERLAGHWGADRLHVEPFPGTAGKVRFDPALVLDLLRFMRDDLQFVHLAMVAGIDWEKHREVLYALWSDERKQYVLLSADIPADAPHIESASSIYPSANWHEREAWELVGITFDHHPDMRHLLTPDGYKFHPLLRSFKLHEPETLEVKRRDV